MSQGTIRTCEITELQRVVWSQEVNGKGGRSSYGNYKFIFILEEVEERKDRMWIVREE